MTFVMLSISSMTSICSTGARHRFNSSSIVSASDIGNSRLWILQ